MHAPYIDGAEITYQDQEWVYSRIEKRDDPIPGPREYRQTLSTVVNGLIERGFVILHLSDDLHMAPDLQAEPGTWDHFVAFAPPWLALWTVYAPETFALNS